MLRSPWARHEFVLALCALLVGVAPPRDASASAAKGTPPPQAAASLAINFVAVDDRVHTAGQPDAAALSALAERGYQLVINLAPPSNQGAVPEEGKLVAEDGPVYVNIPVNWQRPTYADFELFSAVMNASRDRKVLVHCQMNMRASAFTFLWRVIHERVPPETALPPMRAVWLPMAQWSEFAAMVLARHRIDYKLPDAPPEQFGNPQVRPPKQAQPAASQQSTAPASTRR